MGGGASSDAVARHIAAGQTVTVGQYLGDVGSTGASTGPHLHLEIHVNEKPVDPFVWLKANAN